MRLLLPVIGFDRDAAVVADIGDPAIALPLDLGLVRAASLEIAVADKLHVAAVGALFAPIAGLSLRRHRGAQKDCHRRTCQMPSRHGKLLRERTRVALDYSFVRRTPEQRGYHRSTPDSQFNTTPIGTGSGLPVAVLTRKRWPSRLGDVVISIRVDAGSDTGLEKRLWYTKRWTRAHGRRHQCSISPRDSKSRARRLSTWVHNRHRPRQETCGPKAGTSVHTPPTCPTRRTCMRRDVRRAKRSHAYRAMATVGVAPVSGPSTVTATARNWRILQLNTAIAVRPDRLFIAPTPQHRIASRTAQIMSAAARHLSTTAGGEHRLQVVDIPLTHGRIPWRPNGGSV